MAGVSYYRETLRRVGLRATVPRLAVLKLLKQAEGPLSHAQVAELASREGLDRATVYRNLIDLTDAGLVSRMDFGDHTWRFAVSGKGPAHPDEAHPHFICSSCGSVSCLPEDAVAVKASRHTPRALRQRRLQIQIRGLCDSCR
jgi:Fur family ferric uptake transcriptional regulator